MLRILILLILTGCGYDLLNINKKTDVEFIPYVLEFQKYYGTYVSTPVVFGYLNETTSGKCRFVNNKPSLIIINKLKWADFNEGQKEVLLFHELGHCELNRRKHDINTHLVNGNNCPSSVMRSVLFNKLEIAKCYTPHRDYYIQELFN